MYIGNQLRSYAQCQPNKVAIYDGPVPITYARFVDNVERYQHTLLTYKTPKDINKVAICLVNEAAFLEVYFAVITLGWIAIPFDAKWTARETDEYLQLAQPDIVVMSKRYEDMIHFDMPVTFMIEDAIDSLPTDEVEVKKEMPFYLGFTSGSSGRPKAFLRDHHSWLESFRAKEDTLHYGSEANLLITGPLCYSLSLFAAIHALHIGATVTFIPHVTTGGIIQTIKQGKVNVMHAVPTVYAGIAEYHEVIHDAVVFVSAGAKLLEATRKQLADVFPNSRLIEYYGASELSLVTYATDDIVKKYPHSVGKPFPSVHVTVRDEQGAELPTGEVGQVFVQSDFCFLGYLQDEVATQKVLTPYGATTSDVGYLNEAGVLYIVGRKSNMIIRGGQNIYPEEVEGVMKEVLGVKEALCLGVQDEKWGEQLWAFVQWEQKSDMKKLKQHCRKYLASYKRPHKYVELDAFPYTTNGKLDRGQMMRIMETWDI